MKKTLLISILMLSYTCFLCGQNFLPKIEGTDAHDNYFLKGKPLELYHQTYEISQDSLTGKIIKGNILDYFSELSYRISFTEKGDVQEFHYMQEGLSCASLCNFFDPENKYCKLYITNNVPTCYQRSWINNYKEPKDNKVHTYKLIQEEYAMYYLTDSMLLTRRDTTVCIEKDKMILSLFIPSTNTRHDNYPAKDSLYYAHLIDSCLNESFHHDKTINLYDEQEQISKIIEYTANNASPSYIEYFYYDEQGMLVLNKKLYYTSFNEFGETVYTNKPQIDIFRYEYPEGSIDKQGNWTQRYVFRQFHQEKEVPLYMECRKINYKK